MKLANKISEFIKANEKDGMSQNRFAAALGINPAYISGYLKEGSNYKYADKVEEPAKNYIDNFIKKIDVIQDELPFVRTKDAKSIHAVINWAVRDRDMAMISGVAGSGKTRAIKEYVKTHPDSILIEATINTSAKSLFKILAHELGINEKGSIDDLIRQSGEALKKVSKTIIVDEAEHLPYRALESLRRMHDFSRATLVLVGTNKLLLNLTSSKSGNELEQLSSRVGNKWILSGLSYASDEDKEDKKVTQDLEAVCKVFGVSDKSDINLIERLARGNFRKTEKLLRRSKMLSEYAGSPIDGNIIKEATKMLLI
ncbi:MULTISPECIES: AAA family ATPase [Campylobacter]|uniref:AAA family ATPase n=1 Tax=Campylobacter TaxID=194 RepID=UPI0019D05D4B|nr:MULTISPECIES: AAA family ATPase [Campylobacter]MBN7287427.1 AAA family ATPase [Campylobacter curvus]MDU6828120.1 AAA family ATPase [Campylobacter sp.]